MLARDVASMDERTASELDRSGGAALDEPAVPCNDANATDAEAKRAGRWRFAPPAPRPAPGSFEELTSPLASIGVMRTLMRNPLEVWREASFRDPITPMSFFGREALLLSDPAAIQHCFVGNAENYGLHYMRRAILTPALRNGVIITEGAPWRTARRALTPVFNARRVAGFARAMRAACADHAERLAARDGEVVQMSDAMIDLTLDVLIATVFSGDALLDKARFAQNVSMLMEIGGNPHPFDFLRLPIEWPRVGRGRARRVIADLRGQVQALIDARRARADAPTDDLLALLLAARDEDGAPLPDDDIVDHVMTFLMAGHETTARSLTWTLYLLSKAPTERARAEAEVDEADLPADCPDAWPARLPFLSAVIKESMRLYPPAPQIARRALGPDRVGAPAIGEFDIRPGMEVHVSTWVLHRHKRLWADPAVFRPDRFLGAEGAAIPRFAYLPFGLGPRVCIGAKFAEQEMTIALALLLARARFDHAGDAPPMPIMRVTLHPSTPVAMRIAAR